MARHTITGASGFIGANLVARLKDKGEWVRAVDVKETPERQHLYGRADEVWVASDLRDVERAREATDGVAQATFTVTRISRRQTTIFVLTATFFRPRSARALNACSSLVPPAPTLLKFRARTRSL
jgi:nucleoside-diphosphate-sugar epimerase